MVDMHGNHYLQQAEDFVITGKIYGNINSRVNRIKNTFFDRSGNTGVILQGERGSGKTMLTKLLSLSLLEDDVPTIMINTAFTGENFNNFLQSIVQPCMILFDEFEKVYDRDSQESLLTLFDGVHSAKKLFIVTSNDVYRINDFMRNRPGRFYYSFEYTGLERDFIEEYCNDKLDDKSEINSIVNYSSTFKAFNFDILKAIIEEMNRYKEPLKEVIKYINASPADGGCAFEVVSAEISEALQKDGIKSFQKAISDGISFDLFTVNSFYITLSETSHEHDNFGFVSNQKLTTTANKKRKPNSAYYKDHFSYFSAKNIIDIREGIFTLKNNDGIFKIKRAETNNFNLYNYM